MPSIKLGSSNSSNNSLDYVDQKEKLTKTQQKLSQKQQAINQKIAATKFYLLQHGVNENIVNNIHSRAVITNGYNCSLDNQAAKTQFKMTRHVINNRGTIQARTIIQSFSKTELDATNPEDWKKANEIGMQLAQKVAHNHQAYVATHIDNENHLVHNHIVYGPVDFMTGKKEHWTDKHQRAAFFRNANDEISKKYGMTPIIKQGQQENRTLTERQRKSNHQYVWKDDLRERIDQAVMAKDTYNWHNFVTNLSKSEVTINHNQRGMMTFSFIDKNGTKRKARSHTLGSSYEKGVISNELGNREKRLAELQRNIISNEQRTFGRPKSNNPSHGKNDRKDQPRPQSISRKSNYYEQYKLRKISESSSKSPWKNYYESLHPITKDEFKSYQPQTRQRFAKHFNEIDHGIRQEYHQHLNRNENLGTTFKRPKQAIRQFETTHTAVSKSTSSFGENIAAAISQTIKEAQIASEQFERAQQLELEEQEEREKERKRKEQNYHRGGGMHM